MKTRERERERDQRVMGRVLVFANRASVSIHFVENKVTFRPMLDQRDFGFGWKL